MSTFLFSHKIGHEEAERIVKANPGHGPDKKVEDRLINEWTFVKI